MSKIFAVSITVQQSAREGSNTERRLCWARHIHHTTLCFCFVVLNLPFLWLAGRSKSQSIFFRYNLEEEIPLETKEEAGLALACSWISVVGYMGRQVNLTDKSNRPRSFAIYAGKKTQSFFQNTIRHSIVHLYSTLASWVVDGHKHTTIVYNALRSMPEVCTTWSPFYSIREPWRTLSVHCLLSLLQITHSVQKISFTCSLFEVGRTIVKEVIAI